MERKGYSWVFEQGLLDEAQLGFEDIDPPAGGPPFQTVVCHFVNGRWLGPTVSELPYTTDHEGRPLPRTANTYGQNFFEAFCAHATRDGRCLIFRPRDHAIRAKGSAEALCIEPLPEALFLAMHREAVRLNSGYLPRYGTGGRLYLRLKVQSMGRQLKLGPSPSYVVEVFARPIGNYFRGGNAPKRLLCGSEFDRVAPLGTGRAKAGGHYANAYLAQKAAEEAGCDEYLFRDADTRTRVLETGCSNIVFLRADKTYITSNESTVLQSVTNLSLQAIARELMGFTVETRRVSVWRDFLAGASEVSSRQRRRCSFVPGQSRRRLLEAGLCGTAARFASVASILFRDKDGRARTAVFPNTGDSGGPWCTELRDHLVAIQHGDEKDRWGWTEEVRL